MTLSINRLNPNCTTFTIGNRTWYWSFNRCEAFEYVDCPHDDPTDDFTMTLQIRRATDPSPTTAKHMAYMGVSDWPRVDDATFEKMAGGE